MGVFVIKTAMLTGNNLSASFDTNRGIITSLRSALIPELEFIGNKENTSYPTVLQRDQWMGDWRFRIWDKDHFREELTSKSDDIRIVECKEDEIVVKYTGESTNETGLSSVALTQRFTIRDDMLSWEAVVNNQTNEPVEVGEASLAFLTNTDFAGIFRDPALEELPRWAGEKQRKFHEERLFQHLSINGGSSYAMLQRPKGDWPAMLFQPGSGTSFENAYQIDRDIASQFDVVFEGPYYLAIYSYGALRAEQWNYTTEATRYTMCGNRSLVLEPGEEKTFTFSFSGISNKGEMEDRLYSRDQLVVNAKPGMVAPLEQPIRFSLRSKHTPLMIPASNMDLRLDRQEKDLYYYTLSAKDSGHKEIRVQHGGRETRLFFFITESPAFLLEEHARFIAKQQFYENPLEPYGRNNVFLPYDDNLRTLYVDSIESFQVCAMDELCLPSAMYLAEKNVLKHEPDEVKILELFIEDALFGKMQDRETYLAVRGLYWGEIYLSDHYYRQKWSKERAGETNRSFNYALLADIYFGMYRLAQLGRTKVRTADEYLEMTWRTCMLWFDLGNNKWNGAPAGGTIAPILKALKEAKPDWYEQLDKLVAKTAKINAEELYPYGSELYIDQTPHNQVQAILDYYNYAEKMEEVYRITLALRNGRQPAWFHYGNEKRGNVCCWYATPLNTRALYDGFDATGDVDFLHLGYGGLSSFLTTMRRDGAAYGWFLWWPDRTGFDTRTLDTDMGIYGYLYSSRAYVLQEDGFGLVGYGCNASEKDGILEIDVLDGVGRYLTVIPYGIKIESTAGGIKKVVLDIKSKTCKVIVNSYSEADINNIKLQSDEKWSLKFEEC